MIKWLTGAPRRSRDWVTDDPLATVTPRPFQVYAVSRSVDNDKTHQMDMLLAKVLVLQGGARETDVFFKISAQLLLTLK